MSTGKITAYYVASTHWDREWYEPFQHFRFRLVDVLDEALDKMAADPRFACFQTDGQAIILEDYLEIRPERAAQVRQFARQNRLRIGPWYTLPDQNIVAAESLIRNLEEGIRVAGELEGRPSRAGFVCDIFGHVSQLPQIFRNFNITSAFLFRGTNEDQQRGLFRWQGADGSELIAYRFGPREGYFDFAAQVRRGFETNVRFELQDGIRRIAEYVDVQRARVGLDSILLFDGGDHMPIEPQTPELLEGLSRARPEVEVRHTGLDEFVEAVSARRADIPRLVRGELREAGRLADGTWVIPGVLSSRIRLKQSNRARETELCQWAEPFSCLAEGLTGLEYPHAYLRRSWRYILENHAHDSICGCSPDQVHKDMEYRFDQARLINERVISRALQAVATRVTTPDLAGEEFALVLFNPTQADIDGPVDFELWFDEKTKNLFGEFFNYEYKVGFRLSDAAGREIPYDYLAYWPRRRRFHYFHRRVCLGQECLVVKVCAPLRIPAWGYTTIICHPTTERTRHPAGRLVAGDRTLENEYLRVDVEANGSLRLLDKRTGQTYDRLLVVEERADIGDGWYHGVAVNDQIHTSTACPADVALVDDGAGRATLRITNRLTVPERFEFDTKMRRSPRTAQLLVDNYITLRPGADHLEIRTVVDNQVRDHRLRVLFDTGARTDTYLADSAFDVVERPIGLPADNHTYKELAVETAPQANWTAVFDGQRGLAVVAPGLPETAVRDVPARTLALTLLRGFVRTIFTDGEEGGQSLGPHEFAYLLVPLQGPAPRLRLAVLAQRVAGGIRTVQILPRDQSPAAQRDLPPSGSLLTLVSGDVVVTALRRHPQHGYIELRAFNPLESPVQAVFTLHQPVSAVRLVDMEGRSRQELAVGPQGEVRLELGPKQILTVAWNGPAAG